MSFPVNISQLISGKAVEWDRLEFKKGWNPEEIVRSVCAFANDINNWGGGYIVVCFEDNNGVPVLPPAGLSQGSLDKIQKELVNLCHQIEPFPQIISDPVAFQETHILLFGFRAEIHDHTKPLQHWERKDKNAISSVKALFQKLPIRWKKNNCFP